MRGIGFLCFIFFFGALGLCAQAQDCNAIFQQYLQLAQQPRGDAGFIQEVYRLKAQLDACGGQPQGQQTPPQQVGDHCGNGNTCPVGSYCSRVESGRCVQNGKVDCGHYSCNAGSLCGSGNNCLAPGSDDCGGGKSCQPGSTCSRNGTMCLSAGNVDCGTYSCNAGSKCARIGNKCLAADTVDCGSFQCNAGGKCGSGNRCLSQNDVDCGGGKSCSAGNVCVKGGAECLTKEQLAKRVADEKAQTADAARRTKEANEAEAWLKKEKARLAAVEAQQKKEAQQKLAKQKQDELAQQAAEALAKKNARAALAQKCLTAVQHIEAIADGRPSNLPVCPSSPMAGGPVSQPANLNSTRQNQTTTTPGAVLNSDLNNIQTLTPAAATAQAPPKESAPSASPNYLGVCSTFTSSDAAKRGRECPEPGTRPAEIQPGKPQEANAANDPFGITPEQKEALNAPVTPRPPLSPERIKQLDAAKEKFDHDPNVVLFRRTIDTDYKDNCTLSLKSLAANCQKGDGSYGFGRWCARSNLEKQCDVHRNGRQDNCNWIVASETKICK